MNSADIEFIKEVESIIKSLYKVSLNHWLSDEVFSLGWWFFIGIFVISWLIFLKFVDWKHIFKILAIGSASSLIALFFDIWGSLTPLWAYPVRVMPFVPRLLPIDIGLIPVTYMLLYQYYPNWKQFIYANFITSAIYSFVAEPILVKVGLYVMQGWRHVYSFPIYIAIGIACKLIVEKFIEIQKNVTKES